MSAAEPADLRRADARVLHHSALDDQHAAAGARALERRAVRGGGEAAGDVSEGGEAASGVRALMLGEVTWGLSVVEAVLSEVRSVAEAALELEAIDKGEGISEGCSRDESTSGGHSGDEDTSGGRIVRWA